MCFGALLWKETAKILKTLEVLLKIQNENTDLLGELPGIKHPPCELRVAGWRRASASLPLSRRMTTCRQLQVYFIFFENNVVLGCVSYTENKRQKCVSPSSSVEPGTRHRWKAAAHLRPPVTCAQPDSKMAEWWLSFYYPRSREKGENCQTVAKLWRPSPLPGRDADRNDHFSGGGLGESP